MIVSFIHVAEYVVYGTPVHSCFPHVYSRMHLASLTPCTPWPYTDERRNAEGSTAEEWACAREREDILDAMKGAQLLLTPILPAPPSASSSSLSFSSSSPCGVNHNSDTKHIDNDQNDANTNAMFGTWNGDGDDDGDADEDGDNDPLSLSLSLSYALEIIASAMSKARNSQDDPATSDLMDGDATDDASGKVSALLALFSAQESDFQRHCHRYITEQHVHVSPSPSPSSLPSPPSSSSSSLPLSHPSSSPSYSHLALALYLPSLSLLPPHLCTLAIEYLCEPALLVRTMSAVRAMDRNQRETERKIEDVRMYVRVYV